MEYYAVLNMFNHSTPELTTRVLDMPPDAESIWQPSKELAIKRAQYTLNSLLSGKLDVIKWALEQGSEGHSKAALDTAAHLTFYSLKLTALIHLVIANNAG